MSKIALVTNIPAPYRVDLFYYMQTQIKEHEFHVIYTSENEDNRSWKIKKEKMLNTHILHAKVVKIRGAVDGRYVHIPGNIGKVLSEINPDIVIAWEYNPAALQSLFWSKVHHKKFIHLTDGTLFSERNIGKVQKLSRKIITGNCDAAIASSTKAKEKLLAWGVPEDKIFISLLTVDIQPYVVAHSQKIKAASEMGGGAEPIVLFVGRITYGKGIDLLFKALPYVTVPYRLRLVGDGNSDEIQKLDALAKTLKIDKHIEFCGFMQGETLVKEYKEASVFVLPTREDCYGLVLLEALCALKPIVVSKYADGAYDMIINNQNGVIVDPYDEKQLGKEIEKILADERWQYKSMETNLELRNRFSFNAVTKGYLKAIKYVAKS